MAFGPFNLLALGLPNMFGLTGQAIPKAMDEIISCGLDVLPFLAVPNAQEVITQTGNVNAAGLASFSNLIVPDTEAWLVRGFSVGATTGAAELLRLRPVVARVLGSGNIVQGVIGGEDTSSLGDAAAAGAVRVGSDPSRPFLVWGGEFLGVSISRITTAGSISLFAQASIYRFTI